MSRLDSMARFDESDEVDNIYTLSKELQYFGYDLEECEDETFLIVNEAGETMLTVADEREVDLVLTGLSWGVQFAEDKAKWEAMSDTEKKLLALVREGNKMTVEEFEEEYSDEIAQMEQEGTTLSAFLLQVSAGRYPRSKAAQTA